MRLELFENEHIDQGIYMSWDGENLTIHSLSVDGFRIHPIITLKPSAQIKLCLLLEEMAERMRVFIEEQRK